MTHRMKLVPSAFAKIANGSKTIELRLNDEKRQKINSGDAVVFNCTSTNNIITAQVEQVHKFPDFEALYSVLPLEKCGYTKSERNTAHHTDMEQYYTKEQIEKYGALGIELCHVNVVCDVKDRLIDLDILELLSLSVYNPTPERLLNRAEKYQESNQTKVYAYWEDGNYRGMIVFEIEDRIGTIRHIAVQPGYQRKGIGSKLITFVFDQLEVSKIIAETDDDAIAFYKKYGFVVTEEKIEFNTKRYVCICDNKSLKGIKSR